MSDLQFLNHIRVDLIMPGMQERLCVLCEQPIVAQQLCVCVHDDSMHDVLHYCANCFHPGLAGGDLVIDKMTGDFSLLHDARFESIAKMVFTDAPDWAHYPDLGANLSDIRGMPNTRETAQLVTSQLKRAIASVDSQLARQVAVRVVPISTVCLLAWIAYQDGPPIVVPVNI